MNKEEIDSLKDINMKRMINDLITLVKYYDHQGISISSAQMNIHFRPVRGTIKEPVSITHNSSFDVELALSKKKTLEQSDTTDKVLKPKTRIDITGHLIE